MLENISGGTDPSAVLQRGLWRQSASPCERRTPSWCEAEQGTVPGLCGEVSCEPTGWMELFGVFRKKKLPGPKTFVFFPKQNVHLHSIPLFFSLGNSHVKVNLLYLKPDVIAEYSSFAAQYWGIDFWFYSLHGLHFLLRSGSWGSVP